MGTTPLVAALALALLASGGCSGIAPRAQEAAVDVLLMGEQHDDAAHQREQAATVRSLAADGKLAALALEMADRGASTVGVSRDAGEQQVRSVLRWNEEAWPWKPYAPAVMAAVAAGVPVFGANLPRSRVRTAMADGNLESHLDDAALAAQRQAIRTGHCDLLPPQQLQPMVRVQVARDREMAETIRGAVVPGKTVVLLAGSGHVDPTLGVPLHLPPQLKVRALVLARSADAPARDYCEEMRRQMQRGG